ncbi:MAG: aspartate carbamoyltransferase [Muribaculaceae bacterium]|nr:aspartate carbamoyltransferase [Muribaculaceae bacterium]
MNPNSLVTIADLTKEQILEILEQARDFEANPNRKTLDGMVVATLFFEPSTRTRLSFETAVNRLGGRVIGFSDANTSSSSKGETLKDTIKMVSNYVDLIIMRHFLEGAAVHASEVTETPIINAGDGAHQHPTQTMLDLYSMLKTQGTLENLTITLVGDLKYGRTVHSMLQAMRHFHPTFRFVACNELRMPEEYLQFCRENNIPFTEHTEFSRDVIDSSDIIYMTRVQRERFADLDEYERVKDKYILNNAMLATARENLRILHPLPRVNEIDQDVDDNPKAYYFEQARNGLYVRQALISRALGITPSNAPRAEKQQREVSEGEHKCSNPKCITNNQPVKTKFERLSDGQLACHFCSQTIK